VPTNPELQVTTSAAYSASSGTAAGVAGRVTVGAAAVALRGSPQDVARWVIGGFLMTLTLRPRHNQINQNIFSILFT